MAIAIDPIRPVTIGGFADVGKITKWAQMRTPPYPVALTACQQ
jgi:hypothetical protein